MLRIVNGRLNRCTLWTHRQTVTTETFRNEKELVSSFSVTTICGGPEYFTRSDHLDHIDEESFPPSEQPVQKYPFVEGSKFY